MRCLLFSLCILSASAGATCTVGEKTLEALPNMSCHAPNLVASGRLHAADVAKLESAGIRVVINLGEESETPDFDEAAALKAAGISYRNLPIRGVAGLAAENVVQLDQLIAEAGNRPTLIHCASSNRVGALMALRAANLQGASVERALEIGKSWGLKSLEPVVRQQLASTPETGGVVPQSTGDTMVFPRIHLAGGVYELGAGTDMPTVAGMHQLVIDWTGDETTDGGINRRLDVVARAVNLYALAKVPDEKVRIAVVIHGKATPLALSDSSYREHFTKANPNAALMEELRAAGVEFFVCGQALRHRGYAPKEVHSGIHVALSAMTKLVELQNAGYGLIP